MGNEPSADFTLNPAYSSEGISANNYYTVKRLKEIFNAKNLKVRILDVDDKSYGNGEAKTPFIYLLSAGGRVKGSVVKELAAKESGYYASFREFADEAAYKDNPYSYNNPVEITPGMAVSGIEDSREYTLQELQAALDAAEAASRIPNVLKTEITDKKNDAYSGSGTMNDPIRMYTG